VLDARHRKSPACNPVRAAYPSHSASDPVRVRSRRRPARPEIPLSDVDGRGVTIALPRYGRRPGAPFLRGRVTGESTSSRRRRSARRAEAGRACDARSSTGRRWRVSSSAPAGRERLAGVAPGASLLSIRVAGWQRDAGRAVVGVRRTDQILAALERAVDPNGTATPTTLPRIALSHSRSRSPPSRFAPARAAAGALRLDTLVVVPAGNDGPQGRLRQRVGAGRRAGGADGRRRGSRARYGEYGSFSVRASRWRSTERGRLRARSSRRVRSTSAWAPAGANDRGLKGSAAPSAARLLRRRGFSLVASRAALVPVTSDPALTVANAARRGCVRRAFSTEVSCLACALGTNDERALPSRSSDRTRRALPLP